MDLMQVGGFSLLGLSRKNVILGKNGCGKSYLLKSVEQALQGQGVYGSIRYISPERGGLLLYDPNMEQTISNNPGWMGNQRRKNQSADFRQQSATLFKRLEYLALREIEREHTQNGYVPRTFDTTVEKLNVLLDRISLQRDHNKAFKIIDRETNAEASHEAISSGESELISLGIEFLSFVKECNPARENIIFVDEPDVHLHPDLQDRLARFIIDALKDKPITLILATHSTAIWPAPGSEDTELGVLMEPEVDHGASEIYTRVQA